MICDFKVVQQLTNSLIYLVSLEKLGSTYGIVSRHFRILLHPSFLSPNWYYDTSLTNWPWWNSNSGPLVWILIQPCAYLLNYITKINLKYNKIKLNMKKKRKRRLNVAILFEQCEAWLYFSKTDRLLIKPISY